MASATKWVRNAVSFKPNRFMLLSQSTSRTLNSEAVVSKKKKKEEEPSYVRDMHAVPFNFAEPLIEFGRFHSALECFHLWKTT